MISRIGDLEDQVCEAWCEGKKHQNHVWWYKGRKVYCPGLVDVARRLW